MYSKIISQEDLGLVTLSEVKAQCRVFHDFEDEYLESLIRPYSELAQSYTRRMLVEGVAVVVVESCKSVIQLPFGEVTSIDELLIDNVVSTDFTFNNITQKIKINTIFNEATITFKAGYLITPDVVRQAVLIAINTAFVNRDDLIVGQTVMKLPMTSLDLLDSVRLYGY